MIISESQAEMKWCPFTFNAPEQRGPDGGTVRDGGPFKCCTVLCMAWRPAETQDFTSRADERFRRTGERLKAKTGYCAAISSHQRANQGD